MTPELSSFLGVSISTTLPRHEIEARILQYAKDHNLVDPINKIVIHADETLEDLMDGKKIFSGFSIIPNLKHHLDTIYDNETLSLNSDDQLNDAFIIEDTSDDESYASSESVEESAHSEEAEETPTDSEESEESRVGIVLMDPSGNQFIFERCHDGHICIQNQFVISQNEFRQIYSSLCPVIPEPVQQEEKPSEMLFFFVMFLISLITFSLWLSVLNQNIRK